MIIIMRTCIYLLLIFLGLTSCKKNSESIQAEPEYAEYPTNELMSYDEVESILENDVDTTGSMGDVNSGNVENEKALNDSNAIANIYFNITRNEFNKEKQVFLTTVPSLNGKKIKSVNGFFYNERLAAIQIISVSHPLHEAAHFIDDLKFEQYDGWSKLYKNKYEQYSCKGKLNYICGQKGVIVTDLCGSDKPYSSFQDLINQPLAGCYQNEHYVSNDWTNGIGLSVLSRYAKEYLSKEKAFRIDQIMQRGNGADILFKEELEQIRREINFEIEQKNKRNQEKHRNDPTYSVIILIYMPAYNQYKSDVSDKKQKDKQNDIDLI